VAVFLLFHTRVSLFSNALFVRLWLPDNYYAVVMALAQRAKLVGDPSGPFPLTDGSPAQATPAQCGERPSHMALST